MPLSRGENAEELVHSGSHDWNHVWTKNLKEKNITKKENDHDWTLNIMNKQAIVHEYKHENSRNDWWMMRLKAIEVDYYYIEI